MAGAAPHQPTPGNIRQLNGKGYYDLVGFYPPTASFAPQVARTFPYEIKALVRTGDYTGFPGDERFQLLWRNPLNPGQWGFTDQHATAQFAAAQANQIPWNLLQGPLYDEGDQAMHCYAYLQGRALHKRMSLFFVPAIVRGIDFYHLQFLTSLKDQHLNNYFDQTQVKAAGGANMWSWMDVTNVYRMMTDPNFAFAEDYRYWCFVLDQGRQQYPDPQGVYLYLWRSHANMVIIDRRDLTAYVNDPHPAAFPPNDRLPGGFSTGKYPALLPVDVGALLSLFSVTRVFRVRGTQPGGSPTCKDHNWCFLEEVIERGRLPDPVEAQEYFEMTFPPVKNRGLNRIQTVETLPTLTPALRPRDLGSSDMKAVQERYFQPQFWRNIWQDTVVSLMRLKTHYGKMPQGQQRTQNIMTALTNMLEDLKVYPRGCSA